ncbi:elongation factor 1-beta [Nanobdella aerobiophila]|uniref:Elongation factor 1-beta n=1 Tax=Nanobdella aerobiophila TaxID=2586965 RepID=A0A915SFZ8_9ARCH|nr:elongation factor 1-beta [Nanobdella aerobiophila]BBL45764.1 elongation factor 1-beta [Nanobdella aerobiophila]
MDRYVVITLKVSPNDIDLDLDKLNEAIKDKIKEFGGNFLSYEKQPVAFGLNVLMIKFLYPDKEFSEEELLNNINSIEGVGNSEIISVSLAQI